MADNNQLKTYLASFCAMQLIPGIIVSEQPADDGGNARHVGGGAVLACEVDSEINPAGKFVAAFGHGARLMVRYSKEDAMAEAFREARRFLPVEDGWTNHNIALTEIPRSTFIEMELFITAREIYYRILRLCGFRQ